MTKKKMTRIVRFKENPFIKNMNLKTKNKQIKLKTSTKKTYENLLVNAVTGETETTQIVSYRKVDNAEFVKLFVKNIALTFNLSAAGFKTLNVVVFATHKYAISKDIIPLGKSTLTTFLKEFREFKVKISETTFKTGLRDLVKNQIIAPSMTRANYFINPNFIFNGNRFSITEVVENKDAIQKEIANQNLEIQQDQ